MNLDALNLAALRPILPLPMWQKAAALGAAFVLILAAYFYMSWMPMQEEIEGKQASVEQQRILLKKNQRLAQNLPKKRAEFAKLEKQLKVALNMLPKQSQIPDLLENVSWAGKDSGLEFTEFKPEGETVKEIYAEVPVSLNVQGSFRQLLTFLKRVGEMPRIVAIKDLSVTHGTAGDDRLAITGKVVTYRFVDKGASGNKAGKPVRRR